jgi:hypothetical protein
MNLGPSATVSGSRPVPSVRFYPLEARLCSLACSGAIDIAEAQRAISEDWTAAFVKFVGEPRR